MCRGGETQLQIELLRALRVNLKSEQLLFASALHVLRCGTDHFNQFPTLSEWNII